MPREPANWYVMINDAQTGPLTRVELGVEASSGTITGESLVWKEGMVGWLPGVKVPELASLFTSPPRSPRAPAAAAKARKPSEKGSGMSDFDTAHFKVAELADGDSGKSRDLEFDTSHFRLAELKGTQGARASVPRRIAPAGMEPAPLPVSEKAKKAGLKQLSTGTGTPPATAKKPGPPPATAKKPAEAIELAQPLRHPPPPAAKAAPRPAAKKAAPTFDPNKTNVDFMTLGEQVHQQQDAQDLFSASLAEPSRPSDPEAAPEPEQPLPKYVRPPTAPIKPAIHVERGVPVWAMIAGGMAIVAAVVVYFVIFD